MSSDGQRPTVPVASVDAELPLDEGFRRLARLARRQLDAPRAFVHIGLGPGGTRTVVDGDDGVEMRFAVAEPLRDIAGRIVGVLGVVDRRPRTLEPDERAALADLAALGAAHVDRVAARASLDALDQGVLYLDRGAGITWMNHAAERLLGYDAETITAMWRAGTWHTFDEHGELLAPERRPVMRAIMTEQPVRDVIGWRRSDGERLLLDMTCVPVDHSGGGMVVAFTDITEERRASRLLDATLDTAPVGLAVIGIDRTILRCNPTFADLSGQSATELIGSDIAELLADTADRSEAVRRSEELQGGVRVAYPRHTPRRVQRGDGEEVWVTSDIAVIDDLDQPRAIVATFDVTEHLRLVSELERFEHLFRHANDIIIVVDAVGDVLYSSPSTARVLGYPDGWAGPVGLLDAAHPADVVGTRAAFRQLLAGTRGAEPFTMRVRSATGEWRHLECVGVNLLDVAAVGGIVVTCRDTTERERLVEQLAHNATHDHLTGLANRGLLEAQLSAALARSIRTDVPVGLCFVDLDGFKGVNDTWGHAAGDRLLREVARRILGAVRGGDLAARVGGDEFVVMMEPVADRREAEVVATRIRDALVLEVPDIGPGFVCGASVGVAISEIDDTPESLVQRADAALYVAKSRRSCAVEIG